MRQLLIKNRSAAFVLSCATWMLLSAGVSFAEQVRVVDQVGQLRLLGEVTAGTQVDLVARLVSDIGEARNATASLIDLNNESQSRTAISDPKGLATFKGIPSGEYRIETADGIKIAEVRAINGSLEQVEAQGSGIRPAALYAGGISAAGLGIAAALSARGGSDSDVDLSRAGEAGKEGSGFGEGPGALADQFALQNNSVSPPPNPGAISPPPSASNTTIGTTPPAPGASGPQPGSEIPPTQKPPSPPAVVVPPAPSGS